MEANLQDTKKIKSLLKKYIDANFVEPVLEAPVFFEDAALVEKKSSVPSKKYSAGTRYSEKARADVPARRYLMPTVNFRELYEKTSGETFSEMLLRLIEESGEKSSEVYSRANIDRRHFSKIANNSDYQPSKQTVLAFVFALKLNFDNAKKLLAAAGFVLNNNSLFDVIVSFFIEYKIFDVDLVNQALYDHEQSLLGG